MKIDTKPYRLKHVPTGLYFQPHKHRGSHLTKRGKIYQTRLNAFSYSGYNPPTTFTVYAEADSKIYRETKDTLPWQEAKYSYNQVKAVTNLSDWIQEKI